MVKKNGTIKLLPVEDPPFPEHHTQGIENSRHLRKVLRKIRIALMLSIIFHVIIFCITLGFGISADRKLKRRWLDDPLHDALGDNYVEVGDMEHYFFPIAAGSSGFFAITFVFNIIELMTSYTSIYSWWISNRLTPITWFEFAFSDSYLSAVFIMLNGVGEVGSIFQHAMLRAIMNLCGWLAEHENRPQNEGYHLIDDRNHGKSKAQPVKFRAFLVGCLAYLATVSVRWAYFSISAAEVNLPGFVWGAFVGYHQEILFPIFMILSFYRWRFFSDYGNYKISLLLVSIMVKTAIGPTVSIGANARA